MIIDQFNRQIRYLRLSVTDRCNLRCTYCRPGKCSGTGRFKDHIPHDEIMSYEELTRLARIFAEMGVEKVRVTGGEPLVRKGIPGFIAGLMQIDGIRDVSITTNGVLLPDHVKDLKESGLKRINISLDSLKPEKFASITGRDEFERAWKGIKLSVEAGFDPVKINVVAMRGVNDDEFLDFVALTIKMPVHVRFIELMPMNIGEGNSGPERILNSEVFEMIKMKWLLDPVTSDDLGGPAECFRIKGGQGTIGLISPISRHFCERCNRIRLTASGRIKPCLLSHDEVDIKTPMRNGADDESLKGIILKAVSMKWQKHRVAGGYSGLDAKGDEMFRIGG